MKFDKQNLIKYIPIITLIILFTLLILYNYYYFKNYNDNIIKLKQKIKELDGGSEDIETIYNKYLNSYKSKYNKVKSNYQTEYNFALLTKTRNDDNIINRKINNDVKKLLNDKELIIYNLDNSYGLFYFTNIVLLVCVGINSTYLINPNNVNVKRP
jgi:hypothetical protein